MKMLNVRCFLPLLAVLATLTLFTGVSHANLLSGCGACQGSTYLLQYNPAPVSSTGAEKVWDVFLTVNTTNYNGGGSYINAVSVKVASSSIFADSMLVAAPGAANSWILGTGGIGANGCTGAGSGFLCASDGQTAPVPGGSYTWEFHYATDSALALSALGSEIKVQYVDANGRKVGALLSEKMTLDCVGTCGNNSTIPEPTSMALLAGILAISGRAIRRRFV